MHMLSEILFYISSRLSFFELVLPLLCAGVFIFWDFPTLSLVCSYLRAHNSKWNLHFFHRSFFFCFWLFSFITHTHIYPWFFAPCDMLIIANNRNSNDLKFLFCFFNSLFLSRSFYHFVWIKNQNHSFWCLLLII